VAADALIYIGGGQIFLADIANFSAVIAITLDVAAKMLAMAAEPTNILSLYLWLISSYS